MINQIHLFQAFALTMFALKDVPLNSRVISSSFGALFKRETKVLFLNGLNMEFKC